MKVLAGVLLVALLGCAGSQVSKWEADCIEQNVVRFSWEQLQAEPGAATSVKVSAVVDAVPVQSHVHGTGLYQSQRIHYGTIKGNLYEINVTTQGGSVEDLAEVLRALPSLSYEIIESATRWVEPVVLPTEFRSAYTN